jgi:hypothetical protein
MNVDLTTVRPRPSSNIAAPRQSAVDGKSPIALFLENNSAGLRLPQ